MCAWLAVIFFDGGLLRLFGAEETLLPLAKRYLFPVKFVVPSFLMTQLLAAFLRNDGDPGLATKAVLFGGIFNVFGDHFFVFVLKLGILGAGLATAMGSVFSLLLMLTHFWSRKNTLRLEKPKRLLSMLRSISVTGFSTFFIDVAMGILTITKYPRGRAAPAKTMFLLEETRSTCFFGYTVATEYPVGARCAPTVGILPAYVRS